jgi:hypothetical protein
MIAEIIDEHVAVDGYKEQFKELSMTKSVHFQSRYSVKIVKINENKNKLPHIGDSGLLFPSFLFD